MSLTTFCIKVGGQWTPPPSELLHLNQAGVQDLISDLTDAQPSTLSDMVTRVRLRAQGRADRHLYGHLN